MTIQILTNGIYFHQSDMKEEGYYTKDNKGELIKHDYEKPSWWHKLKHFLQYGYAINTETKSTDFLYFDKYDVENVYSGAYVGDAVSIAKQVKKSPYSPSRYKYEMLGNKIEIDFGKITLEIEPKDDGRKLLSKSFNKDKNEYFDSSVYTFLNWDDL